MAAASLRMAVCATNRLKTCQAISRTHGHATSSRSSQMRSFRSAISCGAASADTASTSQIAQHESLSVSWNIKMLYDGECPLCMREVEMLQRRDADNGRICFVDIAAEDYDPAQHGGVTYEQAMERIHAVLPDGTTIKNVEVFKRLYEEVGLGWVYAITQVPAIEKAANAVYDVWAKYRTNVTGRPDLAVVLAEKRSCKAKTSEVGEH